MNGIEITPENVADIVSELPRYRYVFAEKGEGGYTLSNCFDIHGKRFSDKLIGQEFRPLRAS